MKRFKFNLETVLRVRRVQEEQARARLLAANRVVTGAAKLVSERTDHYMSLERPGGRQSHSDVEAILFTLDAAAGAIAWAREKHEVAVANAAEELGRWREAERRVRALERLRERAYEEHAIDVRRDEDRLTDELATTRARLNGAHR